MSRFTRAEHVIVPGRFSRSGRPIVRLTTPMVYEIDHVGSGWIVEAAVDFECDLTSMPPVPADLEAWLRRRRWGRRFLSWWTWIADRLGAASVPHDLLRRDRRKSKWIGDYVFWEAMGVDRVPLWLRVPAFIGVLFNFGRE